MAMVSAEVMSYKGYDAKVIAPQAVLYSRPPIPSGSSVGMRRVDDASRESPKDRDKFVSQFINFLDKNRDDIATAFHGFNTSEKALLDYASHMSKNENLVYDETKAVYEEDDEKINESVFTAFNGVLSLKSSECDVSLYWDEKRKRAAGVAIEGKVDKHQKAKLLFLAYPEVLSSDAGTVQSGTILYILSRQEGARFSLDAERNIYGEARASGETKKKYYHFNKIKEPFSDNVGSHIYQLYGGRINVHDNKHFSWGSGGRGTGLVGLVRELLKRNRTRQVGI